MNVDCSKMKKTRVLLAIALFMLCMNRAWAQVSQWEVYNNIPNFKNVTFTFSDSDVQVGYRLWNESQPIRRSRKDGRQLSMTIHDDYTIELRYNSTMSFCENKAVIPVSIYCSGIIRWQNDQMMFDLNVLTRSQGGVDGLCSEYQGTRYGDVYSSDTYTFPYFEETTNYTYTLIYDERDFFVLLGNDISSTIVGTNDHFSDDGNSRSGIPVLYHTLIKLTNKALTYSITQKSQSEINTETSDMYGKWQWNEDRSVIYLASTTKEAYLVLWNSDGNLSWGFQMDKAATGYKSETAESGAELTYMMLTFDGDTEQSFTFEKSTNESGMVNFQYVQYDRFMGKLKRDASILNQIKDKRTMIVNYKQNGSSKTAMFRLEGLESIYNAITQ